MNIGEQVPDSQTARVAGLLYLATILTGLFAQAFVRGSVIVRDDAAATASKILTNESWYRFGLAADLVMLVCYVVVTALFYELFKHTNRLLSLLAAFFSLIGIGVLAANSLNHFAPLVLLSGTNYLNAFETAELQAAALASLRLHGAGYTISIVFFGCYCILIGILAAKSGFIPRVVGAFMAFGGLSFIASSFIGILMPALDARLPDLGMLGGIGELVLTLWLIIIGVRNGDHRSTQSRGG